MTITPFRKISITFKFIFRAYAILRFLCLFTDIHAYFPAGATVEKIWNCAYGKIGIE